jgi:hypothetical protein
MMDVWRRLRSSRRVNDRGVGRNASPDAFEQSFTGLVAKEVGTPLDPSASKMAIRACSKATPSPLARAEYRTAAGAHRTHRES